MTIDGFRPLEEVLVHRRAALLGRGFSRSNVIDPSSFVTACSLPCSRMM